MRDMAARSECRWRQRWYRDHAAGPQQLQQLLVVLAIAGLVSINEREVHSALLPFLHRERETTERQHGMRRVRTCSIAYIANRTGAGAMI